MTAKRRIFAKLTSRSAACLVFAMLVVGLMSIIWIHALQLDIALRHTVLTPRLASEAVSKLSDDLVTSESGQRGYLLTGDPVSLQSYLQHRQAVSEDLLAVERLTRSDPQATAVLSDVKPVVEDKMQELQTTVELYKAGSKNGALAIVKTNRGVADMARIRTSLDILFGWEHKQLDLQRELVTSRVEDTLKYVTYDSIAAQTLIFAAFICLFLESYPPSTRVSKRYLRKDPSQEPK